jgi:TolA-binding protein
MRSFSPWWLLLPLLAGCTRHDDIRARYEIERLLWQAQFFQRRVNIAFLSGSTRDLQQAIEAYRRVVAADPFARGAHDAWDPAVAADIRGLEVSARVALANLYFATDQYADAGTLYAETLQLGSLNFKDMLDVRMGAARVSYMEGDNPGVIEQCATIFHDVQASPEFWSGSGYIDDVFLNIPVALVRLYHDEGNAAAADSSSVAARAFYQRVSSTWPGTRTDWQARMAVAQLHMIREEWSAAVIDLETILSNPKQMAGDAAGIELVRAEIHAFRLSDSSTGERQFRAVQTLHRGTFAAYAAQYDLAMLRAQSDEDSAAADLRDLERLPEVPDAVASRAMLARAKILERQDDWDEAYALLRRVEQLYPFTSAAMEAPLVVTRHYVATGNHEMLDLAVSHAREYYNSLLERGSAFPGNRSMAQAALVESFLASGKADEAAQMLGTGSQSWDEASTAAGMLKAAEIYATVLHNPGEERATLEKVITRFPGTRYATVARQKLSAASTGS